VTHELSRLRARRCEAERVHRVVETKLELAEQVVAGDAGLPGGTAEVETELALQKSVDALDLLLFTKLKTVAEDLGAATAVLARRVVPALDRALILETTIALQKELHTLAPAEPADGIRVTSHYAFLSFGPGSLLNRSAYHRSCRR